VITNEYVPPGVVLDVFTVSVEDPEPVIVLRLKPDVAPDGSPLTLRATVPLNPPSDPTVTVYVVLTPGATLCVEGVAETLKSEGIDPNGMISMPLDFG
jgi:hypothetical protein